jgi:hypothetical protein
MFSKKVFDKAKLVSEYKYKSKWNIDEIETKQLKINRKTYTSLWILKISRKTKPNQKCRDFCHMFVISKKKDGTLGKKSISFTPESFISKSAQKSKND